MMVRKTPASNMTDEDLLVVVQYADQRPVNTTKFFVYRQNPDITDIFPLSHLLRYITSELSHSYMLYESVKQLVLIVFDSLL